MLFKRTPSPHIKQSITVQDMMLKVLYALIPGALASIYFFGWGVLFNLLIAISVCLLSEAVILKMRQRDVTDSLLDGSALVTACLLALALPSLAPWWITVIASISAIAVAKHLYGGLGFNPFNPAMVGYIVVMISFPLEMTLWTAPMGVPHGTGTGWPDFTTTFNWVFLGVLPYGETIDSISMATPIELIKTPAQPDARRHRDEKQCTIQCFVFQYQRNRLAVDQYPLPRRRCMAGQKRGCRLAYPYCLPPQPGTDLQPVRRHGLLDQQLGTVPCV